MAGPGLISRLVGWWLGELSAMLPPPLRAARQPRFELVLKGGDGAAAELRRDGALIDQSKAPRRAAALVRLDASAVMRTTVSLPVQALSNLDEALAFEMDRHTPFPASQVRFDAGPVPGGAARDRAAIALEVARSEDVEAGRKAALALGLTPARITGGAAGDRGFNLLPAGDRPRPSRALVRLAAAMAALSVVTGIVAGVLWFDQAEARLAAAEQRVATLREMATTQKAEQAAFAKRVEEAGRLAVLKQARPMAVALIDEISARLGDAHWADRVRIEDGVIRIEGISTASSQILAEMEASPLFRNARFAGTILRDRNDGLDRFSLVADIAPKRAAE